MRTADDLVPVEVKSNTGRSKSLRTLIESDTYPDVRWGIKFHGGNVGNEGSIYRIPYYAAFLLRRFLREK